MRKIFFLTASVWVLVSLRHSTGVAVPSFSSNFVHHTQAHLTLPPAVSLTSMNSATSQGSFVSFMRNKYKASKMFSRRLLSVFSGQDSDLAEPADDEEFSQTDQLSAVDSGAHAVLKMEIEPEREETELFNDGPDEGMGSENDGDVPEPPQPHNDEDQDSNRQPAGDEVQVSKTIRASSTDDLQGEDHPSRGKNSGSKSKKKVSHVRSDGEQSDKPRNEKPSKNASHSKRSSESNGDGESRKFKGVDAGVVDGTNVTHLSYMVFKLIKEYDIRSVVDIPCRNTLTWFPALLHQIDFEMVGFKYYCVDSEKHSQDDIRSKFSDAGNPEFLHIRPEEAHLLPQTDLIFSWDGPQQWGVKRTWSFFTGLREIRPDYIMITNNPKVKNANDERGQINLRKQPFHFSQAMRIISHVHESEEPKQLLLYEMSAIRKGF